MKKIYLFLILAFSTTKVLPQYYIFDSIPDYLKTRADAVVRTDQCLFTLIKPGNAVMKIRKAVTLINEKSTGFRYLTVRYDKYSRVNYLKGIIYDEGGNMVRTLGFQDTYDISAMSGSDFYTDDRIKMMYFPIYKYPYTIEYEYEITYSSLLDYPTWQFQASPNVSVQQSGIQIVVPSEMKLRYYDEYLSSKVDSVSQEGKKIYTWHVENLAAYSKEESSIKHVFKSPYVTTAPVEFEYGGFKGSMSSWKEFGNWIFEINKDRDLLPPAEINTIKELTSKTNGIREKIKLVYEYMQSRTRYVSIQIGIGGYRPAEAAVVSKNGFGDCKALVNYTYSLLKAAGIQSFYTLVKAGNYVDEINTAFVNNEFNHIILCVPVQKDTIWLECTNQTMPFNYLGKFTADRYVLVITPQGGKLVRTPGYSGNQSQEKITGTLYLNVLGGTSGKLSSLYTGYNYDIAVGNFASQSEGEISKILYKGLKFNDFSVSSITYTGSKSENPSGKLSYSIDIRNFASAKDTRLYFNPSVNIQSYLPEEKDHLQIPYPDITKDSLVYYLPLNFTVEYIPPPKNIENEFGKFTYQLNKSDDKLVFIRTLELNKSDIPQEKYDIFRAFINSVARADREKIILVRKGS